MKTINNQGFTLIEVLIAMLLIAISFVGLSTMERTGWFGTRHVTNMTMAGDLIGNEIEKMRMQSALGTFPPTDSSTTSNSIDLSWVVTDVGITDVRKVVFTAQWQNGIKPYTMEVPTFISKDF